MIADNTHNCAGKENETSDEYKGCGQEIHDTTYRSENLQGLLNNKTD